MESTDVFEQMINLRKLDISEHPEFFMTEEALEAEQIIGLQGINKEDRSKVTFA